MTRKREQVENSIGQGSAADRLDVVIELLLDIRDRLAQPVINIEKVSRFDDDDDYVQPSS